MKSIRKTKKESVFILFTLFFCAVLWVNCSPKEDLKPMNEQDIQLTVKTIDDNIKQGNFQTARNLIQKLQNQPAISDEILIQLRFKKALMKRINIDFCRNEEYVRDKLKHYYPQLTGEMLRNWETSNALEMRIIDGEKKYFRNAVPNLFRIDKEAQKVKEKIDGISEDGLSQFRLQHTAAVINKHQTQNKNLLNPVQIKINYNVIVDADAVPASETIRCWLPYPREDHARQQNVQLHKTNVKNYIIAPENYPQRSLYMEKTAEAGKPTKFEMELSYSSHAEYYNLENTETGEYNKKSELYKKYTSEKAPHIIFSDRIKKLTDNLIAGAQSPYEKVKRIYEWIDETTPWASALEYSTFWNIPEYVLENKHGDCGMQSLLFITMVRYAGIPAKWQSGWMMHPGHVNLHDWAEVYYAKIGWVPVDQSFSLQDSDQHEVKYFYTSGIDAYRMIVNDDISTEFFPQKIFPRSETVDFQRGEVEWRGGNLYFNQWDYNMTVKYE